MSIGSGDPDGTPPKSHIWILVLIAIFIAFLAAAFSQSWHFY
jgi:hypothetical protein